MPGGDGEGEGDRGAWGHSSLPSKIGRGMICHPK